MNLRKVFTYLSVLLFLLILSHFALAHSVFASELTVSVKTDKETYLPGETITIQIEVYQDGELVPARIHEAYIDIRYSDGWTARHHFEWELREVSPGVFIVQGQAGRPGFREVRVTACVTYCCYSCGCCCQCTLWGTGSTTFLVEQPPCVCETCCPCCPTPPPPCLECRAPDFFLKYFVARPDIREGKRISLRIKDYVMEQLLQLANPVTFREAPPHSVIWSDLPGMGWTNDALSDLWLSLDPETGKISGYVSFADVLKDNYFFFIEALNPEGAVIAGIWIEIAFI